MLLLWNYSHKLIVAVSSLLYSYVQGNYGHMLKMLNILISAAFFWSGTVVYSDVVLAHHVTIHNTPIHNILSTAPQLSISHKALGTLPEDGNVMPKHVGATINN
jgi:hypothetical protein